MYVIKNANFTFTSVIHKLNVKLCSFQKRNVLQERFLKVINAKAALQIMLKKSAKMEPAVLQAVKLEKLFMRETNVNSAKILEKSKMVQNVRIAHQQKFLMSMVLHALRNALMGKLQIQTTTVLVVRLYLLMVANVLLNVRQVKHWWTRSAQYAKMIKTKLVLCFT